MNLHRRPGQMSRLTLPRVSHRHLKHCNGWILQANHQDAVDLGMLVHYCSKGSLFPYLFSAWKTRGSGLCVVDVTQRDSSVERKGTAQLALSSSNIPLLTLRVIRNKYSTDIIYSFFFFLRNKAPKRLEKGLYNHFSVRHVAENKASSHKIPPTQHLKAR